MKHYLEKGKSVGRSQKSELSAIEIESLTPKNLKGKSFDGEKAMGELENVTYKNAENYKQPELDPKIEALLELHSKDIKTIEEFKETIEKCTVEQLVTPQILSFSLDVQLMHSPEEKKKIKKCLGHTETRKSRDPKKDKEKRKSKLASDPTIKSFRVSIVDNGWGHRDEIEIFWTHKDDVPSCSSSCEEENVVKSEKWQEVDTWTVDQLSNSLDCFLINTTYGSPETRLINGKEISRSFWEKKQHFQCIKQKNNCDFIKSKNCTFLSESCLKKSDDQCLVWEKLFKCRTRTLKNYSETGIYGSDTNLWDIDYQENQLFPDVATKLSILNELKKDLQKQDAMDGRTVHLFSGEKQQCSKSITQDIMYDCCSGMDGLSVELKLSKCTADEIALAESRKKGLTHYIGVRKEKFLDLWVSRKDHVFCVFPSKLSRVFQEEARKQLNLSWGDPEKPNCRGLTQEEIKKLDFSKINLIEAFEPPKGIDNQEKIKKIEDRLKQRLEAVTCK